MLTDFDKRHLTKYVFPEDSKKAMIKFDNFLSSLSQTPPVECEFSIGDNVMYTNDYGVSFYGYKIIGFADNVEHGKFIYLNFQCYWSAVTPESLRNDPTNVPTLTPTIAPYLIHTSL